MSNYAKISIGQEGRTELHDSLGLTGAEVSINHLSAGAGVPFVHAHRKNEEIYGVLAGEGRYGAPPLGLPPHLAHTRETEGCLAPLVSRVNIILFT